jgi:hypothetical protein
MSRRGGTLAAHFVATLRASAADRGAARHFDVIAHRFAGRGARIADLRAGAADLGMKRGVAGHEVGGGLADLDAVHHQTDMLGLGMAMVQAMVEQQRLAGVAARPAQFDAMVQLGVGVVMHGVRPFLVHSRIHFVHAQAHSLFACASILPTPAEASVWIDARALPGVTLVSTHLFRWRITHRERLPSSRRQNACLR